MKISFPVFLTACLVLANTALVAQNNWCDHDHKHQELLQADPNYQQELDQLNAILSAPVPESQQSVVRIIPVVFHVVYATESDNISKAQIEDGLRVLNDDFRKLNADTSTIRSIFKSRAADIEIEFRLATKDPQGNCTDGITRTQSLESLTGDDDVKTVINWDNARYYNIWVTRNVSGTDRSSGRTVLGYSYFPRQGTQSFRTDGTLIRHDELGSIGTSVADGRTLTHETGHYLSLYHPFQSPQGSTNGCLGGGDFVADTPPVQTENFGCNFSTNSCTSDNLPDMVENHMDYANCAVMFTAGQKVRMLNVVTNSSLRGGMVSSGNLNFTGINNPPPCAPAAKFEAERRTACVGEPMQFTDLSEEGTPTSWSWNVPGATPATSTAQNPSFTFNQAGLYDVTLQASNAAGSNTTTQTQYLYVKENVANAYDKLWTESFESSTIPSKVSALDAGGDGTTFEVFTNAASHLSHSIILRNNPQFPDEFDELISPAIKTEGAGSDLNFYFDYAFAARNNANDDVLEVYASRDCGETWIRRRGYTTNNLRTAPNTSGNFVPNGQQWATKTINFSAYIQPEPILIKLVFTNGGGNNLYIDNLRFGEGPDVNLTEIEANMGLSIYPNPNSGSFILKALGQANEQLPLTVHDVTGKVVHQQELKLQNGSITTTLDLDLKPGVYLVQLKGQAGLQSQRLIIK